MPDDPQPRPRRRPTAVTPADSPRPGRAAAERRAGASTRAACRSRSEEELARVAQPATVRHAPKFGAFITAGALVGIVVALVLRRGRPPGGPAGWPTGPASSRSSTARAPCAPSWPSPAAVLGGFVGGLVAVLADRRSVRQGRPRRRLTRRSPLRRPTVAVVCDHRHVAPRADGRLNHDLLPNEKGPQDACGVFGVWAPGEEVAKLTYFGLYALQHRGQESAGIATSNGQQLLVYKDMGLVSQVFDETALNALQGHIAIGHTPLLDHRWQHLGERAADARPHGRRHRRPRPQRQPDQHRRAGRPRRRALRQPAARRARPRQHHRHRADHGAAGRRPGPHPRGHRARGAPAPARRVLPRLHGRAHAVRRARPAGRPPAGARPAGARLGRRQRDAGPRHRRRLVRPRDRARRVHRDRRRRPAQHAVRARPTAPGCVFEYVYLARPDTTIAGRSVHAARVEMGRRLARRAPGRGRPRHPGAGVRARPRPSATPQSPGIPFGQGLTKNAYVGPHVHPAVADAAPARHPAQAQPAARGHPRQAPGRRRRLDRARQHPARPRPDAARGRRGRGARAHQLARR